jgi:hypothetical protein
VALTPSAPLEQDKARHSGNTQSSHSTQPLAKNAPLSKAVIGTVYCSASRGTRTRRCGCAVWPAEQVVSIDLT